jgi:hypothetical protein
VKERTINLRVESIALALRMTLKYRKGGLATRDEDQVRERIAGKSHDTRLDLPMRLWRQVTLGFYVDVNGRTVAIDQDERGFLVDLGQADHACACGTSLSDREMWEFQSASADRHFLVCSGCQKCFTLQERYAEHGESVVGDGEPPAEARTERSGMHSALVRTIKNPNVCALAVGTTEAEAQARAESYIRDSIAFQQQGAQK